MKKYFFALFLCLASLSLFSCKKQNALIAAINFNADLEWFEEAVQGMKDMAAENHVKFTSCNSYYDTEVEYQLAQSLVRSHVKAVIISPIDYTNSMEAIDYLKTHGIKVVTWNTFVNYPVDSEIIVNSSHLGSLTGEYLVKYFKEHNLSGVKAAFIINNSYTIAEERCWGFKSSIKPLLDSKGIIPVSEFNSELKEETMRNVRTLLDKNPDIGLIWCWNQTTLDSCMLALNELNRNDILLCGTDLNRDIAQAMLKEDTNLLAVTVQDPYKMGCKAFNNALDVVKGKEVEMIAEIPVKLYTNQDKESLKAYIEESTRIHKKIHK
ncbi:sugar ABC transporter substrate-binding protein [Treponema sp.]|uniref:sugar ABC transporter substrate-binding protein n=1 Tax=Treponema sp. TaxID=166 RepID=UPI0025FF9341|nr:sugar ABC transporter substrate-binding protein [Treponema sp.]MCR5217732.1 sugar ABC transporter substrate-binding protein [Treponema sp.]